MNKNHHFINYSIALFLLISIIIFDALYYSYTGEKVSEIKTSLSKVNEIKILSKNIELEENKFTIYALTNIPVSDLTSIYKTQEELNLKIEQLYDNKYIEKELIEELNIKTEFHEELLDTLINNINKSRSPYILLNYKDLIGQVFIQLDEILSDSEIQLNTYYDEYKKKQIIAFSISILLFLIIISYFIYIIVFKYIVPITKISKSINLIIKTDFNENEKLPEINLTNRVGTLITDMKLMLLKINEKTQQLSNQKQITDKAFQNFKILSDIGKKIIVQLDVKDIVKVVYENINPLVPITAFGIGIYNKRENSLDFWKLDAYSKKIQYNFEKINESEDIAIISYTQTKEIIINDFFKEYKNYIQEMGASISMNKSMIFVPLLTFDKNIGVIYAKFKHPNAYQEYHLDILRNLANYIAIAIQNAQSFEQIKYHQREILERNEELNQQREEILNINENLENQKTQLEEAFNDIKLLSKIGQEITACLSHDQITETLYKNIDKFMDATTFGIGIYNQDQNRIEFPKLIEKGIFLPFGYDELNENKLSVICFKEFKEIIINDINVEYSKYFSEFPSAKHGEIPISIVYLPLVNKGKKMGVITVQSFEKFAYKENDLNILRTLATYISTALVNAKSYEEIENQRNEVVLANVKVNSTLKTLETQKSEIQELVLQLESNLISLKESEQRMSDIINFIPDPMMVVNKEGKVLAWNKSMEELTGVISSDIVGKGNYEYSLAFYYERRPMLCGLVLQPSEEIDNKYSDVERQDDKLVGQAYVPKLDKTLWGAARILYDSEGEVIGAIQVSRDVTERIKTQKILQEANNLLNDQKIEIEQQNSEILKKSQELHTLIEELQTTSAIVEEYNKELEKLSIVASKTDNAVLIADAKGKITWINEGFTRLYGFDINQFIKEHGATIIEASKKENISEIVEDSIKNKKSAVYVTKNINSKGEEIWIQTTLTPIYNEENELVNIIAIDADISKIKIAEKEIENQNKKIKYSIQYASRIQSALLTPKRFIERILAEHFILYKPRDIVSGDFYWISRKQTKILIAVADCTGHGVPGAFMSILGISFLNEIVTKIVESSGVYDISSSRILNQLRVNIIKSLHQKGKQLESKDGMDIALCIFDIDTRTIQYSGANNPLYLIRKNNISEALELPEEDYRPTYNATNDMVLLEILPDKTPIGISKSTLEDFVDKEFKIKGGDSIYLFTDGYIDQFGGKTSRKFLSKNFKTLLLEINNAPMVEQEKLLDENIEKWRSTGKSDGEGFNQIDDILVMGFKF